MKAETKLRSQTEESLGDILDHLLDKSITIQQPASTPLFRADLKNSGLHVSLVSCSSRLIYREPEFLFPYWRRDLWTK